MHDDRLLFVHEVAQRLRCSPQSVWRWIKAGKLKAIKPAGRVLVRESELRRFMERNEVDDD